MPFKIPWVKLIAGLVVVAAVVAGAAWVHHHIYSQGQAAEKAVLQPKLDAANATISALKGAAKTNAASLATCNATNKDWATRYRNGIQATAAVAKAEHDEAARADKALTDLKAKDAHAKKWANENLPPSVKALGTRSDK